MCVLFRLSRVVVSQEKFPREVPAYRPTLFLLYSLPSPWLDREPNQERYSLSVTTSYPFAELTTFLGPSRGLFGRKYNQRDQLNKAKWSASFKTAQLSQFRSISYPSAATYIHTFHHKCINPNAPRHHIISPVFPVCSKASIPPKFFPMLQGIISSSKKITAVTSKSGSEFVPAQFHVSHMLPVVTVISF